MPAPGRCGRTRAAPSAPLAQPTHLARVQLAALSVSGWAPTRAALHNLMHVASDEARALLPY